MAKGKNKGQRTRKLSSGQKKQVAKKAVHKKTQLPSSFRLTRQSVMTIKKYWKPLGGIVLVYFVLNFIFISGFSNLGNSVSQLRHDLANQSGQSLGNSFSSFYDFLATGSTRSDSGLGSLLQVTFVILISLVIIWALRQLLANNNITIKQAYYRSMSPLIPFLLVVLVIFLQLLPVSLGAAIVSAVLSTLITSSGLLNTILLISYLGLLLWSLYMISSSIFALYIVSLPDMEPMQALRSAKSLVKFRRLAIMRKVLYLPLLVLVVVSLVTAPLIWIASFAVVPVFYLLTALAILFGHTYIYSLYRSLLD